MAALRRAVSLRAWSSSLVQSGRASYHGADFEVTNTVALESGKSVSGEYLEAGQASVVLTIHAQIDGEPFTFHHGWQPEAARFLGRRLVQQADLIDNGGS